MITDKTQLTRLSDLPGKAIAPDGVKDSEGDFLCFHFTDGSFAIFYHDSNDNLRIIHESLEDWGFYPYQLCELGLIDEAEEQRLQDANRERDRVKDEKKDRKLLAELLRKYPS